ncbi:YciI family protein [Actinoplanes sp. NPDC023801]|uniref:YciI family protein n=1 Tax=Actinoplanes sp. NPDC023801 TaxID=3154595 RepID=UPI0033EC5898
MAQYFLTVPHDTAESPTMESMQAMDPAEMESMIAAVGSLNSALQEAGAFVHAGGLHPPSTATTVDATHGETKRIPGPFVEAPAYVGGFWIIDAPDEESALVWAERCSAAARSRIEVRALQ